VAQRLRSERKLGRILAEAISHGGDRKSKSHDTNLIRLSDLSDLGITKDNSSRWQRIAIIDDTDFEAWVQDCINTDVT
jgi:hypothetical protein